MEATQLYAEYLNADGYVIGGWGIGAATGRVVDFDGTTVSATGFAQWATVPPGGGSVVGMTLRAWAAEADAWRLFAFPRLTGVAFVPDGDRYTLAATAEVNPNYAWHPWEGPLPDPATTAVVDQVVQVSYNDWP